MSKNYGLKSNKITFDEITEEMQMSDAGFNALMGCTVLWGLICNFFICVLFDEQFYNLASINPFIFILGYFILVLIGSFVQNISTNPVLAFLGFNFISLPVGAVLSICVSQYTSLSISYVCFLTGVIVAIMIIISTLFPDFFNSLGTALLTSLISIIIIETTLLFFFGYEGHVIDYLVVALFSLYIGYDWYKSQTCAATAYNAICCATDIYLDIINIFIRLLEIFGKKKN